MDAPLPILTSPHPVLRQVARAVDFETEATAIQAWSQGLANTLAQHGSGVGLAAPQVGWSIRVIATRCEGLTLPPQVWVNPRIKRRIGECSAPEGCLSVPGKRVEKRRAKRIEVVAFDPTGNRHEFRADGLLARCIQHEIDHLDGVLIEDGLPD